jgi:hypothetical protein
MTNAELAELRGEIFGLKVLLFNCISFIAGRFDDPLAYLDELQQQSIFGIAQAAPGTIRPQHLQAFRNSAAGIVAQAIDGTKEVHSRAERPPTRQ